MSSPPNVSAAAAEQAGDRLADPVVVDTAAERLRSITEAAEQTALALTTSARTDAEQIIRDARDQIEAERREQQERIAVVAKDAAGQLLVHMASVENTAAGVASGLEQKAEELVRLNKVAADALVDELGAAVASLRGDLAAALQELRRAAESARSLVVSSSVGELAPDAGIAASDAGIAASDARVAASDARVAASDARVAASDARVAGSEDGAMDSDDGGGSPALEVEVARLGLPEGAAAPPSDALTGSTEIEQARLVAVDLALSGATEEQIGQQLEARFGLTEVDELLEDVFARVHKFGA